jgi:Zn-finger nucleic acid-binding protein
MNCPVDQTELRIADRQGIEIDYCPQCRGVWLDRGELDKIVERQATMARPTAERIPEPRGYDPRWDRRRYDDDDDEDYDRRYPGRRRRGWLGDLFDFD